MATNFSPSSGSYVLNKFQNISQWSDTGPSWPSYSVCVVLYLNFDSAVGVYRKPQNCGKFGIKVRMVAI